MKLKVDQDLCIGCGMCAATCDIFEINEEGYSFVNVDEIPKEKEKKAIEAMDGCPTGAIIEEFEEKKAD